MLERQKCTKITLPGQGCLAFCDRFSLSFLIVHSGWKFIHQASTFDNQLIDASLAWTSS